MCMPNQNVHKNTINKQLIFCHYRSWIGECYVLQANAMKKHTIPNGKMETRWNNPGAVCVHGKTIRALHLDEQLRVGQNVVEVK